MCVCVWVCVGVCGRVREKEFVNKFSKKKKKKFSKVFSPPAHTKELSALSTSLLSNKKNYLPGRVKDINS